ncbi:MAG: hypothetical protein HDS70_05955 [Bacteroidales bacterium]|nr:hypothetical protein [Bacteroidales bacterium]
MVISLPRYRVSTGRGVAAIVAATALLFFSSCFTGIESTAKVKLSREDKKLVAPTAEELFARSFLPDTLKDWVRGRKFVVADKRLSFVLPLANGGSRDIGDTIVYEGVVERPSPGGSQHLWIQFRDGDSFREYDTERPASEALRRITSLEIPMLIDVGYVDKISDKLKNKELYVRTSEWYDEVGNPIKGKKYIKVTLLGALPGTERFPFKVGFRDEEGATRYLLMSAGQRGTDSRTFQSLFSMDDIRVHYKNISDTHWTLIEKGEVTVGMTREACRLSLGSPTGVSEGRDYARLLDEWNYGDGKYLKFVDGLLTEFRL